MVSKRGSKTSLFADTEYSPIQNFLDNMNVPVSGDFFVNQKLN